MRKLSGLLLLNKRRAVALPPADWRMPATVAVSSGISGSQSALAAAQAAASSKSRPSFTVSTSGTEYVEYTVAEAGTVILSWLGQLVATATVALNGVSQGFSPRFPSGGTVAGSAGMSAAGGRRQFVKMDVSAGDVIRLTIAAGAATRTIRPLLHKLPANSPWEAYIIFGASRESDGLNCQSIENAIIADDATRDPIMFSHAFSGKDLSEVADIAQADAPQYVGVAYYAVLGNVMGNSVSDSRPYDSGQKAALDADIAQIVASVSPFSVLWCSTTYRQYASAPTVTPSNQADGSLPYNDNVLFPAMLAAKPELFDNTLQRPRIDCYMAILRNRASLDPDGIHEAYPEERAEWVRTAFKYVKTGTWAGIKSFAELVVADAEANATSKNTALRLYTEGTYAMAALASTSEKTSMEARLAAIYPTALFFEAVRLINAARATASSAAKATAQTALDAAETAGFVDMASPNTIAEQQAALDAITVVTYDQIINIGFGVTTAVTGWNRTNSTSTGNILTNMLDDQGVATGVGVNVTVAATSAAANSGQISAIPDIPDLIMSASMNKGTGSAMAHKYTGLDPAKTYDILLMGCTVSSDTDRVVTYSVNGVAQSPTINPANNVSEYVKALNVSPNGSGEISITITRTSGTLANHSVTRIMRRA